ncbi:MAG: hypothetical protein M3Q95_11925 [Bacteroidota bacterium]|nr:hypothetical protein [Bacteroidota bacterium]
MNTFLSGTVLFVLWFQLNVGFSDDTTKTSRAEFSGGLSFSLNHSSSPYSVSGYSLLLISDLGVYYELSTMKASHIYTSKLDIGFTYFQDSIWYKHADKLQVHYLYKAGKNPFSHSLSSLFHSHILNTYSYSSDPVTGKVSSKKTESFLNPFLLEMGLGSGYRISGESVINVSLATARIRSFPESNKAVTTESIPLGTFNSGIIYFDYGFSIQYYLVKEIKSKTEINCNGKIFIKGIERDQYDMDLSNTLIIRLSGWVRLKAEFKFVYAPGISYKPRYYNELSLGLFYNPVTGRK